MTTVTIVKIPTRQSPDEWAAANYECVDKSDSSTSMRNWADFMILKSQLNQFKHALVDEKTVAVR